MNAACQGEAVAAAVKIFGEYGSFIRSMIRLRVHDAARREDVFQELFLRLVDRSIPSDVQNIKGYLYRMVLHDVVDVAREQENEHRHLKKYAEGNRISIYNRGSPNALSEETGQKGSVFTCLVRQLRRREAQVMTLRYRDDYSIPDIAAELGIDRRSVSRYLASGLQELRRLLAVE